MGTAKVLIIDHYDSYTNNILQLLQGTRTGHDGVPYPEWNVVIVRFDQFSWYVPSSPILKCSLEISQGVQQANSCSRDQFFTEILPSLDAIILSPGPGTPEREADFGFNARLLQEVSIPILGICLGHQGIGTSFGAKVVHTPNIKHGQICQIHHRELGVLKDLPQGFDGVRYNSLVLDLESTFPASSGKLSLRICGLMRHLGLPRDLEVTAWTFDPEDASKKVLMGIQHRNRPIFGTQWHPESICSAHGKQILQNFHEIVLDFWATGNPGNRWTKRPLSVDASLPQHILKENVTEPVHAKGAAKLRGDGPPSSAYYIKSTSLGKGPVPQVIFHSLFRNNSPDGEIWLDSAKVC